MTGVPVLGVLPYLEHALPDEDGAALITGPGDDGPTVAVIRYPTASNLDEFKAVESVARLRWAWKKQDIEDADLVILPGSKFVAGDLAWLQANGSCVPGSNEAVGYWESAEVSRCWVRVWRIQRT